MPCIRFLLADDPVAGKTIMAGLLLKEVKISRTGQAHIGHHAGQLVVSVAARNEGKIPRAVRDHSCGRAPRKLRNEPVAGTRSSRYIDFLGLANRRRQGKPSPQPTGFNHREAHKMAAYSRQKDSRVPPRRVPVGNDRPLSSDDRNPSGLSYNIPSLDRRNLIAAFHRGYVSKWPSTCQVRPEFCISKLSKSLLDKFHRATAESGESPRPTSTFPAAEV
jgi:hypothetical protein